MDEIFDERILSDLHTDIFRILFFDIGFVMGFVRVIETFDGIAFYFSTYRRVVFSE